MRFFRKFVSLLFLSAFLVANAASAQQSVTAAAFVNDEVITVIDVMSRTNLALLGSGGQADPATQQRIQKQVLDNLINESLQRQEAAKLGLDLPSNEVNAAASRIAKQNGKNLSQFLSELEKQGITRPTLLNQVKSQLSWQILVGRRYRSQAEISDAEVARVRQSYAQSANLVERQLSEIFLPYTRNTSQSQTVATMQSLVEQIKGGKNFSFIAQQFSQSPSAVDGGDLGWVQQGSQDPLIEQGLASVAEGDISPPIQTADGVYLYGLRGVRPIGKRVTGQQVNMLQLFFTLPVDLNAPNSEELLGQSIEAQQKLARAAAIIQSVQGCDQFKTAIQRFGETGSGDMGFIDPATLPADLGQISVRIEEGRVTPPYPVPNGAALFMVCGKKQVTEDISEEEIRNTLLEDKLQGFANRYLRDLKSRAFIDVRLR